MGYGTLRLNGQGIYGEAANRPEALEVLKTAAKNGVNFIDTADCNGFYVTDRLIVKALYPAQNIWLFVPK